MDFWLAQKKYAELKKKLSSGLISQEEFGTEVLKLRFQDSNGTWWQIKDHDGTWLKWTGSEWRSEIPPTGSDNSPGTKQSGLKTPGTFFQFILMLLQGIVKSILKRLPLYLFLFLAVWLLHTYFLVGPNNGYWKVSKWYWGLTLALKGYMVGGTLFWMLSVGLIFSSLRRIKQDGLGKYLRELAATYPSVRDLAKKAENKALPMILGGSAGALLLGSLIDNRFVSILMALAVIFSLSCRQQSLLFLGAGLAWADLCRLFRRKDLPDRERQNVYLLLSGTVLGFVLQAVLPFQPYAGYVGALLILVLAVTKHRGAAVNNVIVLSVIGSVTYAKTVYGHDGGVYEAGGWANWIRSQGASTAIFHGLPPAIAALLAAALGLGAGDFISLPGVDAPEGSEYSAEEMSDALEEFFSGQVPLDGLMLQGGPQDNPFTSLFGGDGPGLCQDMGLPNYWVNTANLNLVIEDTFFKSKGVGPAVVLATTYNANPGIFGMMGRSWSFAFDSSIMEQSGTILLNKGSGQVLAYQRPQDSLPKEVYPVEFKAIGNNYDRLLDYGQYWLLLEKRTRLVYRYDKIPEVNMARLTVIEDYNGNCIDLNYNQDGTLESIRDAVGRKTGFYYNEQKLCSHFMIADGREARFSYDETGNLVRTEDLLGIICLYEYDQSGYLQQMKVGSKSHTTLFTYQKLPWGNGIASVTDAESHTVRFELVSEVPRQVRQIDAEGKATIYQSNQGLTEKVTDPLGNYTETGFRQGLPVRVRDKSGHVSIMENDQHGNMLKYTDALGNVFEYRYDSYGNLLEERNPLGEKKILKYDEKFNLTEMISPSEQKSTLEYNSKGLLTVITAPDGTKLKFSYDSFGNMESYTDAMGAVTKMEFDRFGFRKVSSTDPRGFTSRFIYDENNRLLKITHPDGYARSFTYDCCAGKSTRNEMDNVKIFERDRLQNITKYIDSLGNVTAYCYDINRRQTVIQDPKGGMVTMTYDDAGRLGELTQSGRKIEFKYRQGNNLSLVTDERGKSTAFEYDGNNLPVSVIDPLGNKLIFVRDPLGRITEFINARGQRLKYDYNQEGQPAARYSNNREICRYSYGISGLVQEFRDTTGITRFKHDAGGRITAVTYPDIKELRQFYDAAGNLEMVHYPGDLDIRYEYNERNWLTAVSWKNNKISLEYDAVGNVSAERRSNRTESFYKVDANGRITGIKHNLKGSPFVDLIYNIDAAGNLYEETGIRPIYWRPDQTAVAAEAVYNDVNQIVRWNSDSYTYDQDGNLVQISGSRKAEFLYDSENHMTEMSSGNSAWKFVYDGQGRRIRSVCGEEVKNYYYNPFGQLLFESDQEGTISTYYIYAGMRLLAMVKPGGDIYYYHYDNKGSTISLTDNEGNIAASYAYTPFGAVDQKTGDFYNPFTFIGAYGVFDIGNNIFFMKRRYYDALTGKFMQKDPIGFAGGFNLYAYVQNNPLNRIDPEGTVPVVLPAVLILATFMAIGVGVAFSDTLYSHIDNAIQGKPNDKDFLEDFGDKLAQIGDKIATVNPLTSPGWAAIKTFLYTTGGDIKQALWNAPGAIANEIGSAWTAFTEAVDAYIKYDDKSNCGGPK